MRITVIGMGYVGLVTGAGFAELGNSVIGLDIDKEKITHLNDGILPIYEAGLKELVHENLKNKRLKFTTQVEESISESEIIFIAVGTPEANAGQVDLSHVENVAHMIGQHIDSRKIIVCKSTVPVGTHRKIYELIDKEITRRNLEIVFDVVSNPEFFKEGDALNDFFNPDRIIIGSDSELAKKKMSQLYTPFTKNGCSIICMSLASAEMAKYAANAMLATRISFMNEISQLCECLDADISSVREGIGSDPRIGRDFLQAGLGYGGSCFPKDLSALAVSGDSVGISMDLIKAVSRVNLAQRTYFLNKILSYFDHDIFGKKFALWGLAYKQGTDDVREAPACDIISKLTCLGAKILAYDPMATKKAQELHPSSEQLLYKDSLMKTLDDVDALIIATEWREFYEPDFDLMKKSMKSPVIFDGRNIYSLSSMFEMGFEYYSIGRKSTP